MHSISTFPPAAPVAPVVSPAVRAAAARELVLGEVRRANLNGRLYPDPPREDAARNAALEELAADLLVEPVLATPTSLGGWFVVEPE
jgi:hypothetical protein